MMIRRIFAGSIVALLLSVSSIAAACDLYCAFGSMNSDCHARQTLHQDSQSSGMNMDGMDMAGMTMPEMDNGGDLQLVSAMADGKSSHPSIGEMGPCERQTCDSGPADSARTSRFVDSHLHSILAIREMPHSQDASSQIHEARDDVAAHRLRDASPLNSILRI